MEIEVDLHRWHQQKQPGSDSGQVVGGGDPVHDPLVQGQVTAPGERVGAQQDLETSGRPAQLLLGVGLDGVGRVADRQGAAQVGAAPTTLVQFQGRPHVLRLGVGVDAADLLHGRPTEHHVGADAEGRVEVVATRLDEAVEDRLHVARAAGDHRVQVAVGLGGLHEGHGVVGEEGQHLLDELGAGHEVGVEDAEEAALGLGERVVEVAGLGAAAAQPTQVEAAELFRQLPHLGRAPVVEQPRPVPAADGQGRLDRAPYDLHRFAVDGHEHFHPDCMTVEGQGPSGSAGSYRRSWVAQ